jgi:hypothetical protein
MTSEELIQLQDDIDALKDAIAAMTRGERVTQVRFADRVIQYAEISLPELKNELTALQGKLPASASRLRHLRYQGL